MNTETLKPALTADEWQTKSFRREAGATYHADHISLSPNGDALRIASEVDGELVLVAGADRHALAALALYEQPFGFSTQDVEDEREVAEYCEAMARQIADTGDDATSLTFRSLAERHRARASKIAALLP
jgi:hypothetical protein